METVAIVDYGMSNLRSVAKALAFVAGDRRILVTGRPEEIRTADRLVFPGQGAIGACMRGLEEHGLAEAVRECARNRPYLGICLGQQCLLASSEEDDGTSGLGIVPGTVRRFAAGRRDAEGRLLKVPHMGWNRVEQCAPHALWEGIESGARFYFVHSFYPVPDNDADVAGRTDYIVRFAAAIARENLFAVQFHPEKSQGAGLRLIANFLRWRP
jgi:glutamine amidotransferase